MSNANSPAVYVLATLDTKGVEAAYVVRSLAAVRHRQRGWSTSARWASRSCAADIPRSQVFAAAGADLAELAAGGDRGAAVTAAAAGARALVAADYARGAGGRRAGFGWLGRNHDRHGRHARAPLGVPKVMVSTLASGQVRQFVGNKDIFMLNSVVDIAG